MTDVAIMSSSSYRMLRALTRRVSDEIKGAVFAVYSWFGSMSRKASPSLFAPG